MGIKLSKVSCKYGAPMGRRDYHGPSDTNARFSVARVDLDRGGYDNGGAYWGSGEPLWRAFADCPEADSGQIEYFIRAPSRHCALVEVRGAYPNARFFNSRTRGRTYEAQSELIAAYKMHLDKSNH